MYCTLADVHTFLNIPTGTTADDALIRVLIGAAHQRINSATKRNFEATADLTRYYDTDQDVDGAFLCLDADLSHITSISNGGAALPLTEIITDPRNQTPYERIKIISSSTYYWTYTNQPEDAISVTGRWACMLRKDITAIARATNVVTATIGDTTGLSIGATVYCVGVADSTFNGGFTLTAVTDTTVSWAQTASNDTDTTGVLLFTPPDIRQACTRLTAWLYRQKDTQQGDADRPLLAGDGTVIMPTTLPQDVQALIREWIKIR